MCLQNWIYNESQHNHAEPPPTTAKVLPSSMTVQPEHLEAFDHWARRASLMVQLERLGEARSAIGAAHRHE